MKKLCMFFCVLFIGSLSIVESAKANEWRFPFGLGYASGLGDLVDIYEDNLEAEGYDVDTSEWPVGLLFQPYYQFDNGLRIGVGLGPTIFIYGDADHYEVPLNLNIGYSILPSSNTSPYVRCGVAYHIAGGDYVEGSNVGFFGALGVVFFRNSPVGFGIEVAYDASEIELERYEGAGWLPPQRLDNEDVETIEVLVSIYAVF